MSVRTRVGALASGMLLALLLQGGEAAAQNVCRGGPYTGATGSQIECTDTSGSTDIVIDPGDVNVARIHGDHRAAGNIIIRVRPGITITGSGGNSVLASRRGTGDVSIVITGGVLQGIASATSYGAPGAISVSMSGGALSGRLGAARNGGTGNAYVTVSGDATIRNTGINSYGVFATNNGLGDELSVRMTGGSVETTGSGSHGIFANASNDNGATAGPAMNIVLEGGSVRTRGAAHGVFFASYRGSRDPSFRMTGGSVVTEADNVHSVDFWLRRFAAGQTASVRMTGGSIVAEGLGSRGLASLELYYGSFDVMTGPGAEIEVPFAVGMEGLLEVNASATGRLVFAHGGAVSARDIGVLARAARSSGYTMGPTPADDAARTKPMIHVTSSGDITTGASVTDAFIRARITGEDGTLSTAEQAVLSAITAGDSDALTTALAALPDDYDADWKAEAQDLLRKRTASSAAPTGDGPEAHGAAEKILGLSRAGVRAYALSHTGIVDHIRAGDALSTAERAALDAVLTKGVGSGLETALTALTGATYTTAWKNTVRRLAATYNAGDIQVDVTGGSITAEGNGVEALYAVRHDSNGAIAVTVAEGARITGGAHGIHVRGAGAGTGGLRAQSVTVNGAVTGGTGAGVHMADGGRLVVGKTGRVGATSGMGVLSDGAGDLHATVAGTVEGDIEARGGGDLMLDVREGGAVTGTAHDPVGPLTVAGSIGRLLFTSGGAVTVTRTGRLTGVEVGGKTEALRSESGDLSLTVAGMGVVTGDVQARGGGDLTLDLKEGGTIAGTVHDPVGPRTVVGSIGRLLYTSGGAVTVTRTGRLTGVEVGGKTEALRSESGALSLTVAGMGVVTGDVQARGGGRLTLDLKEGGTISGTVHDPVGPRTVVGSIGRLLYSSGGAVTVTRTGRLTGVEVGGKTEALRSESGALSLTVAGMGVVTGDVQARGGGRLTLDLKEGGTISGTVHDPVGPLTVVGSIGRLLYSSGGAVTVTRTGALTGVEADGRTEALGSESGDLSLTVADKGMVTGDVQARGGRLTLDLKEGGTVSGTVHDPVGPLTVVGSIGRLLYTSGGAVTVTRTGRLTGVEADGRTEALRSESGALSLTVADKGTVTGDVQARGGGRLTLDLKEGGTISGTVHDPAGPLTVVGSIGRLLYSSGGAVTVARTGVLTGVEADGKTEAIRAESGDLDVTVAGRVAGDLRAPRGGMLRLNVQEGGTVAGTAHDPVGPLTVAGSIGRLLYSSGGAVTVTDTGRLTGVEVDGRTVALRSDAGDVDLTVAGMATGDIDARGDGDLTVSVSGTVDGDIFGRGAGEHTVTVARGGAVTGTVNLGASAVTADGAVGRVRFERGGAATVGSTGRISGIDGVAVDSRSGDLTVTVAGLATGDIDGRGGGDLTVMVSGTVDGDVFGREAGEHAVTVERGGAITGTVDLAGDGAVTVEGAAGRIDFERDGMVTVGPAGRISGRDGVAIESRSGAPAVTIVASADESLGEAVGRVGGTIVAAGGEPSVMLGREGETGSITLGGLGTARSVPEGAYDVGVEYTASGALRVVPRLAPRTRVYEALPSLLLGMERPASHAERAAAPRASNGAWARIDASRGSWEAASSANAGTAYDHRGFSFQAGVDAVLGEETRAGLSVHVRRVTAKVSRNGGEIEARGAGVGLSATWSPGPFFVDGQAAATLYDVDLKSSLRGRLKDDVGAQGLSAALEAGRMVPVADGVTVTPRARVAYSSLSLSDFVDDAAGARVSLDRGRSLTGRAGALAERVFGEGRIFGSVDVEREFSAETRMSVAGTSLETAGEETRWLVGVGGEHGWEDGRFALRGALDYAASGGGARDYGARASLSMRF